MPMLHGILLNLSLRFRLFALLLQLLCVLLLFLLHVALHLSQLGVFGEITSQFEDQSSGLIVVVALAGGFDTSHLMAENFLLNLSSSRVTQRLRLPRPKQCAAIGRTDI